MQTLAVRKIDYVGRVATEGVLLPRERRWYSKAMFWQADKVGRNRLIEPFSIFITTKDGGNYYFHVEAGTITDFASVPWYIRGIIPQHHPGRNAAFVVHDGLYSDNCVIDIAANSDVGSRVKIDRKTADVLMRDILRDKETAEWMVQSIYRGIIVGGWLTWKRYRKLQQARENNAP